MITLIRRWGIVWYCVGIGGTLALIAIWITIRIPGNLITRRGSMVNETEVAVEAMQWAFAGLTTAIIEIELQRMRINKRAV